MANYCNFDAYLVGKKEDIDRFNEVMGVTYEYNLKKDFLKKLGIYGENDWEIKEKWGVSLERARERARGLENSNFVKNSFYRLYNKMLPLFNSKRESKAVKNEKAMEILKDENLKKEYFENIPESEHFHRVFEYHPDEDMQKIDKDLYISRGFGVCAWSLESCIIDSDGLGYNSQVKKDYPETIFMGTSLIEFAKKVPDLKIALISQEPGLEFSEFYTFIGGKLVNSECEDLCETYCDTIEDLEDLKEETGIDVSEEDLGKDLYLKFPDWFKGDKEEICIDEDYVFEKLGI